MHTLAVSTYLPVLGISGEHEGIFGLRNLIILSVLDLLNVLLSSDALIFGEGTVVALLEGC